MLSAAVSDGFNKLNLVICRRSVSQIVSVRKNAYEMLRNLLRIDYLQDFNLGMRKSTTYAHVLHRLCENLIAIENPSACYKSTI